jgi:hypothetical protein
MIKQNPSSDGGLEFNINHFSTYNNNWCDNIFELCLLQPCTVGRVVNHSIGMPFLLGCLCMNICFLRNIVRYHYRIKPTFEKDEYDELCMPLGSCLGGLCFCNPVLSMAYTMSIAAQVVCEVQFRPKANNKRYLLGYTVQIQDASFIEERAGPYCVYDYPNRFIRDSPLNFKTVDQESVETVPDINEYYSFHKDVRTVLDEQITISPESRFITWTSEGNIKYTIPAEDVQLSNNPNTRQEATLTSG